jgi:CelD/BcsL family acetyltransferase involved in cellulose biosynthesis
MDYKITGESIEWLAGCWQDRCHNLTWDTLFVLPPWLDVWRQAFAPEANLHIAVAHCDATVIGVAPLLVSNDTASFIGSPDVCDYSDFIVAPGTEHAFCEALLNDLKYRGIRRLDLGTLRPESTVMGHFIRAARGRGYEAICQEDEVSLERDLPTTWEEYLQLLNTKQRHEIRRKLRRLERAAEVRYRFVTNPRDVPEFVDTFMALFARSRDEKAAFMTPERTGFFNTMSTAMAEAGLLRSSVLELDGMAVAALIAFDYNGVVYLYNNSFDPDHNSLSVGILSKALFIKDSIERGRKRFDFLKGNEHYKYHLGGQEVQLYRCHITIA